MLLVTAVTCSGDITAIFKTGNGGIGERGNWRMGTGNREQGTGNGESLKRGIFKSGNL